MDAAQDILATLRGLAPPERVPNLVAWLRAQDPRTRVGILRDMLGSPEKWQRDLSAAAAAELGVDPLAEDAEPVAEAGEPVLTLGFDDEGSAPPSRAAEDERPALIFTCPSCSRPLAGSDCPACGSDGLPPPDRPIGRMAGLRRPLSVLALGAVVLSTWFFWPPSMAVRERNAKLCQTLRGHLEKAVLEYRAAEGAGELGGRFMSGADFQDELLRKDHLETRLTCPGTPGQDTYTLVDQDPPLVRCRRHP